MASSAADSGEEPPRRRVRRRRGRAARHGGDGLLPLSVPEGSSEGDCDPSGDAGNARVPSSVAAATARPVCIIDRTARVESAEAELRHALVVTIGGNHPPAVEAGQVLQEVARSFDVDIDSMQIMAFKPEDFLLLLPDWGIAERVYNGGLPLQGPGFTLLFKQWSRFAHADAVVLPDYVEGEITGVPAHAWELATAQQLLGRSCWVQSLHPDTAARRDLSSFRFSAWRLRAEDIPPVVDLIVPEPNDAMAEAPPQKRGLVYPVRLTLAEAGLSQDEPPSPPPASGGHGGRRRRRCRRRSPLPRTPSSDPAPGSAGGALRGPVHSRLGPLPPASRHVVLPAASLAFEAPQPAMASTNEASPPTTPLSPRRRCRLWMLPWGLCLRRASPRPMARDLRRVPRRWRIHSRRRPRWPRRFLGSPPRPLAPWRLPLAPPMLGQFLLLLGQAGMRPSPR